MNNEIIFYNEFNKKFIILLKGIHYILFILKLLNQIIMIINNIICT